MKTTLSNISDLYNILINIKSKKSSKVNYWIMRNLQALNESYMFFVQSRQELYETYLVKGDDNQYFTIDDRTKEIHWNFRNSDDTRSIKEFNDQLMDLFSLDCEIDPYQISIDTIFESDVILDPEQFVVLDCLLKNE